MTRKLGKKWVTRIMLLAFFILHSSFFISCSLEEDPKDQRSEEEIYTDAQAVYKNAVLMLYSYVGGSEDGQGLQGTCRGVYDLNTFASDEALIPRRGVDWYDGGMWQQLYYHTWGDGHEIIKNSWYYLYKVVAQCNRSLYLIDKYSYLLSQAERVWYEAEVRAIRAIYYWYLMDFFGRVPIVTSTQVSMNSVVQSERSEVFEFVRSELEYSMKYLSSDNSTHTGSVYGRVTAPVVYFVLAKLYLNAEVYADDDWTDGMRPDGSQMAFNIYGMTMNAWEACEFYCELISQLRYELSEDYSDNFAVYNENGKENIWIIPMDRVLYSNQQQNIMRSIHWRHAAAYGFKGSNGTSASLTALDTYHYGEEDQDPRFVKNYYSGEVFGPNSMKVADRNGNVLTYYPREVMPDMKGSPYLETAGARMRKYEIDQTASGGGKLPNNDIVLFRYADVLLMRAEAMVRNGEDGSQYFDQVRNRAYSSMYNEASHRDCTLDNLYDERLLELAWEGWRRNDMVRYGKYSPIHTSVFPIPANALALNKKLEQNKGY